MAVLTSGFSVFDCRPSISEVTIRCSGPAGAQGPQEICADQATFSGWTWRTSSFSDPGPERQAHAEIMMMTLTSDLVEMLDELQCLFMFG